MAGFRQEKLNKKQIEAHLKSAVEDLTPRVLDRIDLSTGQLTAEQARAEAGIEAKSPAVAVLGRRLRVYTTLAAACLCMVLMAGGFYTYQNNQVDSVIGIDVNPSVELSVNRKNKVLEAIPLNEDAVDIMSDMELKGVDLNVAVNAVIGSMVTHGYLDDLDNAILVTVSNDSIKKASSLRSAVVEDIQTTLEENQVKAVVYDQQAIEEDHIKKLAEDYGISYGKAYFLKELIDQNPTLSMDDMGDLAPLTMEEIAKEIAAGTYAVGGNTEIRTETSAADQTEPSTASTAAADTVGEKTTEETVTEEAVTESQPAAEDTVPATTGPVQPPSTEALTPTTAAPAETTTQASTEDKQETVTAGKIRIDNADYENGVVTVSFATRVKWKNPTVSVKDEGGTSYSAMIDGTDSSSCEIYVSGLEGETTYSFVIGGISPKNGKATTVKGTFDTPIFGTGQANEDFEESEPPTETETPAVTEPSAGETTPSGTVPEETAAGGADTTTEAVTTAPETTKETARETETPQEAEPKEPESKETETSGELAAAGFFCRAFLDV